MFPIDPISQSSYSNESVTILMPSDKKATDDTKDDSKANNSRCENYGGSPDSDKKCECEKRASTEPINSMRVPPPSLPGSKPPPIIACRWPPPPDQAVIDAFSRSIIGDMFDGDERNLSHFCDGGKR